MLDKIAELKARRFLILKKVYELSEGNEYKLLSWADLGAEFQLSDNEALQVLQYLSAEHLITWRTNDSITISHWGIVQIEAALTSPQEPTKYFPPVVNIIQIEHMENSQIQQGSSQSSQDAYFPAEDLQSLEEIVKKLRQEIPQLGLPIEKEKEATAEVATIEAQLSSTKPKKLIVRESLKSIRNILEGATGSAIATGLLSLISNLRP